MHNMLKCSHVNVYSRLLPHFYIVRNRLYAIGGVIKSSLPDQVSKSRKNKCRKISYPDTVHKRSTVCGKSQN